MYYFLGGYDWKKYTPPPSKSSSSSSSSASKTKDDKKKEPSSSGFDYSKYYPASTKNIASNKQEGDDAVSKALLQASQALLDANDAIKRAKENQKIALNVEKKKALDAARNALLAALNEIDKLEANTNNNEQPSDSPSKTKSPTINWKVYINGPSAWLPNNGENKPGSVDGPCGKTVYKDFGECANSTKVECIGASDTKPGRCALRNNREPISLNVGSVKTVHSDLEVGEERINIKKKKLMFQ